jgi:hypothetical protein
MDPSSVTVYSVKTAKEQKEDLNVHDIRQSHTVKFEKRPASAFIEFVRT